MSRLSRGRRDQRARAWASRGWVSVTPRHSASASGSGALARRPRRARCSRRAGAGRIWRRRVWPPAPRRPGATAGLRRQRGAGCQSSQSCWCAAPAVSRLTSSPPLASGRRPSSSRPACRRVAAPVARTPSARLAARRRDGGAARAGRAWGRQRRRRASRRRVDQRAARLAPERPGAEQAEREARLDAQRRQVVQAAPPARSRSARRWAAPARRSAVAWRRRACTCRPMPKRAAVRAGEHGFEQRASPANTEAAGAAAASARAGAVRRASTPPAAGQQEGQQVAEVELVVDRRQQQHSSVPRTSAGARGQDVDVALREQQRVGRCAASACHQRRLRSAQRGRGWRPEASADRANGQIHGTGTSASIIGAHLLDAAAAGAATGTRRCAPSAAARPARRRAT